jgi:hypothetical protein
VGSEEGDVGDVIGAGVAEVGADVGVGDGVGEGVGEGEEPETVTTALVDLDEIASSLSMVVA